MMIPPIGEQNATDVQNSVRISVERFILVTVSPPPLFPLRVKPILIGVTALAASSLEEFIGPPRDLRRPAISQISKSRTELATPQSPKGKS